jgi:hypothetical protein
MCTEPETTLDTELLLERARLMAPVHEISALLSVQE